MKPITDDVVHSLLRNIAAPEKSGRLYANRSKPSAKIIKFSSAPSKSDVVVLHGQRSHRTISGVFCYVSRLTTV